jgi:hypothetical protein
MEYTLEDSYTLSGSGGVVRSGNVEARGQCFTVSTNGKLGKATFSLKINVGSPPNYMYAKLYEMTGTYGTDGKPTGNALAVSDAVSTSVLTSSYADVDFFFSGVNQVDLTEDYYCIVFEYDDGDVDNSVAFSYDTATKTHSGNSFVFNHSNASWASSTANDSTFYVYSGENVINSNFLSFF